MTAVIAALMLTCILTTGEGTTTTPQRKSAILLCGPQCVHHLLQHDGWDLDFADFVRSDFPNASQGEVPLSDLVATMRRHGYHASSFHTTRFDTLELDQPVICHLSTHTNSRGHYVVVSRCLDGEVIGWDPNRGDFRQATSEFSRRFTGYGMYATANAERFEQFFHSNRSNETATGIRLLGFVLISASVIWALPRWSILQTSCHNELEKR